MVAVAVAGVIFVGHGNVHADVYDHHSQLQLGASLRRGKASLSAAFRDAAAAVAGLRKEPIHCRSESAPVSSKRCGPGLHSWR